MWRSPGLAPTRFSTAEAGARHKPGATRVGPRARRARLTKSGAAPCGRATGRDRGDAGASGRDLEPESDLTAVPGPARSRTSLPPPGWALSVPFFRENKPLSGPGSARQRTTPAPCARRWPAPAAGLQVRGRAGLPARACQAASPPPPAALQGQARAPRHRQEAAPRPAPRALPCEPEARKTGRPQRRRRGAPRLQRRGAEGSRSHNGRAQAPSPPPPAP